MSIFDSILRWYYNFKPKRILKYFYQRKTRGFSDKETWNVQHEFAKWVVPRLKRFKEVNNGYPYELTEEEWDNVLDEIIEGFSIVASDNYWGLSDIENDKERIEEEKKKMKKIDRAVDLWSHHFHDFWW